MPAVIIVDLFDDMRTTVKTFWICLLLTLVYSFGSKAANLPETLGNALSNTCEATASLSSYSSASGYIGTKESALSDTKYSWSKDVELANKPITETFSSNQQRLRRTFEDESFLKNILLVLSNHENLLVQDRTKLYYSDKYPCYAMTGCGYYVFTLRRILI